MVPPPECVTVGEAAESRVLLPGAPGPEIWMSPELMMLPVTSSCELSKMLRIAAGLLTVSVPQVAELPCIETVYAPLKPRVTFVLPEFGTPLGAQLAALNHELLTGAAQADWAWDAEATPTSPAAAAIMTGVRRRGEPDDVKRRSITNLSFGVGDSKAACRGREHSCRSRGTRAANVS